MSKRRKGADVFDLNARPSRCLICRNEFKSDECPHDNAQVATRLFDDRIRKIIKEELKKLLNE